MVRFGNPEPVRFCPPAGYSRLDGLQSLVRLRGGNAIALVCVHCYRDIAGGVRLVDGKRKFVAIDGGIDVVSRRKPNTLSADKEAVVAKVVIRIVNANVEQNPTEQLLTIGDQCRRLGIGEGRQAQ